MNITGEPRNTSNNADYYPLLKQPLYMVVIFSIAYTLIFVFAFFGNLMVIAVVLRNKSMRTVTNYFIVNLAVSDLLVAIVCVPITLLDNLFHGWRIGAVLCKASPYLQGTAIGASIYTLTAIAIDRNLAICYMLQFRLTRRICYYIITVIWCLSLCGFLPWALFYQHTRFESETQEIYTCSPSWPHQNDQKYYVLFVFLVFYIVPLIAVSICYGMIGVRVWFRNIPGLSTCSAVVQYSKVRAVKMLLLVFVLFAVSWLPLYTFHIWTEFTDIDSSKYAEVAGNIIVPICQWLGLANSGINPVIYCFFSNKFRAGFLSIVPCMANRTRFEQRTMTANSTKYMSVQYTNGQYQVSLKRLGQNVDDDNVYVNKTAGDVVFT